MSEGRGHRRSRQIRADIDRTRASLDRTFDALGSRLTPAQLFWDGLGVFRSGASAGVSRALAMAREHPVPATVIGVGVGWLLLENARAGRGGGLYEGTPADQAGGYASGRPGTYAGTPVEAEEIGGSGVAGYGETEYRGASGGVRETASEAVHKAGEAASRAGERVSHGAQAVKEKAAHTAETVRHQASRVAEKTRQTARRTSSEFDRLLRDRPLAVGLGALAVGVLGGLLLPATRREDELLGQARDRNLDKAREATREAYDKGKQVARTAVETAKETVKTEAERQQLTPRAVVEKVVGGAKQGQEQPPGRPQPPGPNPGT